MVFPHSPAIEPWLPIVTAQVKELARRFPGLSERSDLEAIGRLALLEALAHYDTRKHATFPHYATCFVRGRILRALVRECRYVCLKAELYGEGVATFAMGELVHEIDTLTAEPDRLLEAGRESCDELVLGALVAGVSMGQGFLSHDDLEEAEEYEEAMALVERLLRGLPPELRSVMELVYGEGLTQHDAAARLDVHRNTIAYRLRCALRSMRETLIAEGILSNPHPPPHLRRETSVVISGVVRSPRGPPDSSRR
jgi:RNA polymerase sigma factor (sigma-70 family)